METVASEQTELTVQEAATRLGVSSQMVYNLCRQNELDWRATATGRCITVESVEARGARVASGSRKQQIEGARRARQARFREWQNGLAERLAPIPPALFEACAEASRAYAAAQTEYQAALATLDQQRAAMETAREAMATAVRELNTAMGKAGL